MTQYATLVGKRVTKPGAAAAATTGEGAAAAATETAEKKLSKHAQRNQDARKKGSSCIDPTCIFSADPGDIRG